MICFGQFVRRFRTCVRAGAALSVVMLPFVHASAQQSVAIHQIMTGLPNSPLLGQSVSVSGIVVGVFGSGGYYITAPSTAWDTNNATAEGIEIFTQAGVAPQCAALLSGLILPVAVGNVVTVVGTVANGAAVNGANTPGTGINPTSCTMTGTGAVGNTITLPSASSYVQDLAYTGMPVANTVFNAIAPTGGTTNTATGMVASTGQFWVDLGTPTNGHLFKTAGLEADNFYPPPPAPVLGSSPGIPTWNGNPQRLFVDTASFGGTPIDIGAGQTLTCKAGTGLTSGATTGVGVIDYSLGYNRLLIFKTTTCTVSGSIAPSITSVSDSTHFHVGTLNLNNFAGSRSPAYSTRLAKAALAIVNVLGKPEIISIQEVQDLATLQAIGDAASALAGSSTSYQAYWSQPNDATNFGLGFLVNTQAVAVSKSYQVYVSDTFTQTGGNVAPLWERPPFVLETGLLRNGENYQVEVVNIETTSRAGIDDPTNGPNVWERRGAQSEELSTFANTEENRGQNLLIAGEFNAYSFSDGFNDLVDTVIGKNSVAQGAVAIYEPAVTNPAMYNFVNSITVPNSTYNVIENGNARSIEHILCSETQNSSASGSIYSYISFVTQAHWTTDFPAIDANDPTIPAGLTMRDGFVGAFLLPPVPTTVSVPSAGLTFGSVYLTNTASQTLNVTNTSVFPSTVHVTNLAISGANAADFSASNGCVNGATQGASCPVTVVFAPLAAGARSATLTVTTDAGANPVFSVSLTGTGLDTTATLTPAMATYPTIPTGTTSAAQSFTWTNTSPVVLTITAVTVSGDFAVTSNSCSGALAAGAQCSVSVDFQPTSAGVRMGTLTVQSTSSANGVLTAQLTGTGVTNIAAAPVPLNLGNVDIGATGAPTTVVITNYSTHSISLTSFAITGDYSFVSKCPAALSGPSQCTVLVTLAPTALGVRPGALSIGTTDPATPVLTIPLTGNGVDFSITLSPTSGTVIAGRALSLSATLTPLGGFASSVQLACAVPANVGGSTCEVVLPRQLLNTPTSSVIVITTTAQYTVIGYSGIAALRTPMWGLLASLGALLLWFARRKSRGFRGLALAGLLVALGVSGLGCSGKYPDRNPNPTYPGTYTYTATVSDGFLSHSATFSMTATIK